MADNDTDAQDTLIGIAFADVFRAQEFLTAITRLAANGHLRLKDAVFVTKTDEGNTIVKETADLQTGPTAIGGAMWAGLFGLLLGGPVGLIAGAAIGAGAGAATAKAIDFGITDQWVAWFREAVEPGNTILAVLAEDLDRESLAEELTRFSSAHLVYVNLDQAWTERLRNALGEPEVNTDTPPPVVP
jgi:uncharacterized membrane protein